LLALWVLLSRDLRGLAGLLSCSALQGEGELGTCSPSSDALPGFGPHEEQLCCSFDPVFLSPRVSWVLGREREGMDHCVMFESPDAKEGMEPSPPPAVSRGWL
jgi:hypothetical protein